MVTGLQARTSHQYLTAAMGPQLGATATISWLAANLVVSNFQNSVAAGEGSSRASLVPPHCQDL